MEHKRIGRPAMYTSPDEMQKRVDEYFDSCAGEWLKDENNRIVLDKFGIPILKNAHPPTITGLALALGFATRQSLLNYQRKPPFGNIITIAKSRVEQYVEESLFDCNRVTGAKFSLLCCFGWAKETQLIDRDRSSAQVKIILSSEVKGGS